MLALDLERIILKPFVLRPPPPSWQIMHIILLNWSSMGSFFLCFKLIAYPKGLIDGNRIGFGANNFKTFCSQTPSPPPSRQIVHRIFLNWSSLGPFLLCFYLIAHPKGPIERDRVGFGANNFQTFRSQAPLPL